MVSDRLNAGESAPVAGVLTAFQAATGMGFRVSHNETETPLWACENAFCRLMRLGEDRGSPCATARVLIAQTHGVPVLSRRCGAGLEHVAAAVPSPAGVAVWIESGQVFLAPPRREDFTGFCQRHPRWLETTAMADLEAAFVATPVLTRERLEAGTNLLRLVALCQSRLPLHRG
jgi:hypothetical protein